jgi:hypothetical protein
MVCHQNLPNRRGARRKGWMLVQFVSTVLWHSFVTELSVSLQLRLGLAKLAELIAAPPTPSAKSGRRCGFDSAMVERKAQNNGRLVAPGGEQLRPILILEAP